MIFQELCVSLTLAYNPCKRIDAFKIKNKFYYKNINN